MLRRFSNMLRFCWVLLAALLDSLTAWVRGLCQEHIDISTVLRIERSMLMQQAKQVGEQHRRTPWTHSRERAVSSCPQGKVPTREAIHVYYQEQMMRSSRESGLDFCSHDDEVQSSGERGQNEDEDGASAHQEEEETAEQKPETEADVEAAAGEDGLEGFHPGDGEHGEEQAAGGPVATTSQTCRPKLSRMDRVESSSVSSSSDEEERGVSSHRCASVLPALQRRLRQLSFSLSLCDSDEELPADEGPGLDVAPPLLPPSYSLALGLDLQEELEPAFRKQPLEGPSGGSSYLLADSASTFCPLTSHIQALTASELLKNR